MRRHRPAPPRLAPRLRRAAVALAVTALVLLAQAAADRGQPAGPTTAALAP